MATSGLPFLISLAGSLSPYGVLNQSERENQLRAQELARRTGQLQSVAGQAEQAYGEAAGAPPPGFLPGDVFIPQLLGALSSVIARDPAYQEQARAEITQRRAALMETRAQNLQQLRDVSIERARAAREAGDIEEEFKSRNLAEKQSKLLGVVLQSQRMAQEEEQAQARRAFEAEQQRVRLESQERGRVASERGAEQRAFRQGLFQITKAYNDDPNIGKYEQMVGFLKAGAVGYRQNSGLGDVALVFAFMRALEPGNPNSVREGEAKNVAGAVGMLQKYQAELTGLINKKGDRFLPEGRRAVMRQIAEATNVLVPEYVESQERFGMMGAVLGIPLQFFLREADDVSSMIERGDIDPSIFVEEL